jgi:hypothetical protein
MGELTTVVGVIHPSGAGGMGGGVRGDEAWTLRFSFEAWRGENGILHSSELTIRKSVTNEDLHAYMRRLQPYQVVSAQVIFTTSDSAELVELRGLTLPMDDALVRRATELQKPKTYEHEHFGILMLDRSVDWYVGWVRWGSREIRLNLEASDDPALEAALRAAVELWQDQLTWNQRIQEYAVQKLLDLKNNVWLEDDEDKVSSDDFKSRMNLAEITILPNGEFSFWHHDGDLFFGHWIHIVGNLRDGLIDARVEG